MGRGEVKKYIVKMRYVVYEQSLTHQHMPCSIAITDSNNAGNVVYFTNHHC